MSDNFVKEFRVCGMATDPIYIGTGGYTIGRVDNTIVRDPITKLPKIPGSSLAGTWRYYTTLELQGKFEIQFRINKGARKEKDLKDLFNDKQPSWVLFEGNRYAGIKCAGQDELPGVTLEESKEQETGHCGHCIVCKGFGFSKKDLSWQGMIYFSDLNIVFFPVFTRFGTKWITTKEILKNAGLYEEKSGTNNEVEAKEVCLALGEIEDEKGEGHINLGWIYLPYKVDNSIKLDKIKFDNFDLTPDKIVLVPESLFSQIVNSNLEVRTSVSIDPITGAAKEGALFTSEAIPRGTIFYGDLRIHDKSAFEGLLGKVGDLPDYSMIKEALCDSKHFFEALGIGGMTTRGFGRMKLEIIDVDKNCENGNSKHPDAEKTDPNGGEQK